MVVAGAALLSAGGLLKVNCGVTPAGAAAVSVSSNTKSTVSGGEQLLSLQLINSTLPLMFVAALLSSFICCLNTAWLWK